MIGGSTARFAASRNAGMAPPSRYESGREDDHLIWIGVAEMTDEQLIHDRSSYPSQIRMPSRRPATASNP